jgi:hypothetical protein
MPRGQGQRIRAPDTSWGRARQRAKLSLRQTAAYADVPKLRIGQAEQTDWPLTYEQARRLVRADAPH